MSGVSPEYLAHASTRAGKAQMEYLKEFAQERPAQPSPTIREGTQRASGKAWWIIVTIVVVLVGVTLWAFSR